MPRRLNDPLLTAPGPAFVSIDDSALLSFTGWAHPLAAHFVYNEALLSLMVLKSNRRAPPGCMTGRLSVQQEHSEVSLYHNLISPLLVLTLSLFPPCRKYAVDEIDDGRTGASVQLTALSLHPSEKIEMWNLRYRICTQKLRISNCTTRNRQRLDLILSV